MTNFINAIMQYNFLQNAILISILSSICCGILGTYIVYKRMVFITSSISHASFGGIGIGIFLGYILKLDINPIYFAIIFSILCALLILYVKKEVDIETDTLIGIIMAVGMAIGILFIYISPGYQAEVSTYLFGNILLANKTLINLLFVLDIIIILIFVICNKIIKYLSFDEKFYGILNIPINQIEYIMIIIISTAIILNIKSIGIVLILSILTLPQAIASLFFKSYNQIAIFSIIISLISMLVGLYLSYEYMIPTGPSIVLTLSVIFVCSLIVNRIKK